MPKPSSPGPKAKALYTVSVRTLCAFAAKRGDLDRRFAPGPSAADGVAGHVEVTSRRSAGYQREITLAGKHHELLVRGRADGFDPQRGRLEEIKTHRGDLSRVPANHRLLHWAQAKVYAYLLCLERGLPELDVALVYFDIGSARETVLCERHGLDALRVFFQGLCDAFLAWARQELAHRDERDRMLGTLAFPHGEFRAGQRTLAEAVYRAHVAGICLLAQAPTGIGKTVATLYPALRAAPTQRLDKLFYLTARTTGRQLALDALQRLQHGSAPGTVRVLELVARDKACEHPDRDCQGDSCPLARGFYDRLPAARQALLAQAVMDKATLRSVALAHTVCPYYLAHEMLAWSDVVVGDYNHYFGFNAVLYASTVAQEWRVGVLVDEAHNLIERARSMYTAQLHRSVLREARRLAPLPLKPAFDQVDRAFGRLLKERPDAYVAYPAPPATLVDKLQRLTGLIGDQLADDAAIGGAGLLDAYFGMLHFLHVAALHGPHALFDVSRVQGCVAPAAPVRGRQDAALCLRNVIPAPLLKERWNAAHASVLFSATLDPADYFVAMLGLPPTAARLDVPSPFDASQLQIHVASHISTRYGDRTRSLGSVVQLIARQYAQAPGNYLAYFSSFAYLQQAADRLQADCPGLPVWRQSRQMDEAARAGFLARFSEGACGIGFAVLGGAFGEGIDLPGRRLIGVFIATLGLPQMNEVNEHMRQVVQRCSGQGYAYTYLYPGLQKVVQAAGRVIRSEHDTGVVHLIDDRFGRPDVRALLPSWWRPQSGSAAGRAAL